MADLSLSSTSNVTAKRDNTVEGLYALWLKENRQRAAVALRESDRMLGNLRNIGSTYWLTVKAMRDARARVLQVWLDMPESLPGAETATDREA